MHFIKLSYKMDLGQVNFLIIPACVFDERFVFLLNKIGKKYDCIFYFACVFVFIRFMCK